MLQRAASNAYSWWWASHIRTKQSKWLEQNLQDMEEKVHSMLKLISEDGDSFAKRAEMYYKRRPELINFVEESYRAYRSLAERYDHISTELQNANNALATYFPDQVQFAMDDDDEDEDSPRRRRPQLPKPPPPSSSSSSSSDNVVIPKVPKAPLKDLKSILSTGAKKLRPKKESEAAAAYKKACSASSSNTSQSSSKSGLTKPQALEKIDKLQKDILGLQTVKEFVKSSYEGGLAKYWEIEDQITSMQAEASSLQDEFNETVVIDDDEARSLMTATALKSCQDTLANLQHKHHNSVQSAKLEQLRIKEVRNKFNALTNKQLLKEEEEQQEQEQVQEEAEAEAAAAALEEKIKQHYNIQVESSSSTSSSSSSSLTVAEMTEKIDELVNKVISLETAVSSQDALIARLKNEADDLQSQIQLLDKDGSKLQEMEHKLQGVENLNADVKKQSVNLHTHFTEAKCNLQHLYKVHSIIKSDDNNNDDDDLNKQQTTTTGGSLLPKKMDQVVVDEQDGNINNDNVSPKVKKDFDSNKEFTQGEPKPTTTSSSSSQKPRTESSGGGGLLSGAKKLMGFKVVQEEVRSSSSSSVVSSSDSGKQNKDNIDDKMNKKKKKKKEEKEEPSHVVEDDRITGSQTQTSTSSVELDEEKKNANAPTEATAAADYTSQSSNHQQISLTPHPHPLQDQEMMIKNSVADEIQLEKQQQQDDYVMAKQQEAEDSNNEEEANRQRQEEEKTLSSSEYTTTLRNYKDMKRKLSEENKTSSELQVDDDIDQQLRALKTANALKDEEIQSLREKLHHLQTLIAQHKEPKVIIVKESFRVPSSSSSSRKADHELDDDEDDDDDDDDDDDMKVASGRMMMMMAADEPVSEVEEKLRMEIDQVLEVNLDFWLRFSEALNQIQKYESVVEDLRREISKLEEMANSNKQQQEGSSHRSRTLNLKSDLKPIYKHLSEIQTELTVWMDKCLLLKEEQQSRFTSLCDIQEEITKAVKASAEDEEFRFTSYQAAKFQGEVLNMKQENNKVANELQAGLDHITVLQLDVDRTLDRLNDEYVFSAPSNTQQPGAAGVSTLTHSPSRARVPLRSFIFGVKQKKRPSIFTCMTPAMHRKYNGLRVGF